MPDDPPHADGARVLADLNALRAIGTYKTGVHKPTFSEPHMRSVEWLTRISQRVKRIGAPNQRKLFCENAIRPSCGTGDGEDIVVIWARPEQIYFWKQDWTNGIRLNRFNNSLFPRSVSRG